MTLTLSLATLLLLCLTDHPPASRPTTAPSPTWLTLRRDGPRRETVPPLILFLTDADRRAATEHAGDTPTIAQLTPDQFHSVLRHLPTPASAPSPPPHFSLTLGSPTTRPTTHALTTTQTRTLLHSLTTDPSLPPTAHAALHTFQKSHGL